MGRIPAALVRICFDDVLGSPTPTLLIATTLNSYSTQGFKSFTVACIICPGTESGTRIKEFRIEMCFGFFYVLLRHISHFVSNKYKNISQTSEVNQNEMVTFMNLLILFQLQYVQGVTGPPTLHVLQLLWILHSSACISQCNFTHKCN